MKPQARAGTTLFGRAAQAHHVKWIWLALLIVAVPHAAAVEEADAKSVDPMIAEVGHTPDEPQPGTQWEGFIRFEPGHNVTAVHYQACKVGDSCFFPPTPAQRRDNDTWAFNTSDYGPPGQQVAWGVYYSGEEPHDTWRVGVQYLVFRDGEDEVYENAELLPEGVDTASQECADLGGVGCSETHYFAFDMPARAAGDREAAPGLAAVLVLLAVAIVAWGRR